MEFITFPSEGENTWLIHPFYGKQFMGQDRRKERRCVPPREARLAGPKRRETCVPPPAGPKKGETLRATAGAQAGRAEEKRDLRAAAGGTEERRDPAHRGRRLGEFACHWRHSIRQGASFGYLPTNTCDLDEATEEVQKKSYCFIFVSS
ncbi:uncharacterized protein LOC115087287 isoform X3 [Rhinatrema bivittatum]|uniref:uncharacterized protein LOC115087287 isoform X3 n=1 Tax=Rhinatrema bivittatum TaxID=194408 RepID=UPI0011273D6F|nr:uncharacterized protein LOC115087287 isoform X3 [Rhinatrema bivittatum]